MTPVRLVALSWTGASHSFEPSMRLRAITSLGVGADGCPPGEGLAPVGGDDVGAAAEADEESELLAWGRTLVVGVALAVGLPGPVPQPSVYTTTGWHLALVQP